MNIALLIHLPMTYSFFIHPIFLDIHHPVPALNFSIRPGLIYLTTQRTITECLMPVLLPASGVPVVNYYFYRHPSSPHAAITFNFISPGYESPMPLSR